MEKVNLVNIDPNAILNSLANGKEKNYYSIPSEPFDFYGGIYFNEKYNCFCRMDMDVAEKVSPNVTELAQTTCGGRIRFATNSKEIFVKLEYEELEHKSCVPYASSCGITLVEESENNKISSALTLWPLLEDKTEFSYDIAINYNISLDSKDKKVRYYTMFLPLHQTRIKKIIIGLEKDSIVTHGRKYKFDLPILYYGSSITQGGYASRIDNCYQGFISKWHNVDFINLGFSGNAKGEPAMADYLSTIKSKVFVLDYDYNSNSPEHLQETHYNVYETYRKHNPTTPIIMMTRPNSKPDMKTTKRRLEIVQNTYLKAKELGDNNVYFINGQNFFKGKDRASCMLDGTHPTDLGFYKMAKALDKVIAPLLKD